MKTNSTLNIYLAFLAILVITTWFCTCQPDADHKEVKNDVSATALHDKSNGSRMDESSLIGVEPSKYGQKSYRSETIAKVNKVGVSEEAALMMFVDISFSN